MNAETVEKKLAVLAMAEKAGKVGTAVAHFYLISFRPLRERRTHKCMRGVGQRKSYSLQQPRITARTARSDTKESRQSSRMIKRVKSCSLSTSFEKAACQCG